MLRKLLPLLAIACLGCSSDPGKNPDAVNVTGKVTYQGKALTGVVLNLQPIGPGHPVTANVVDGQYKALVTPGKYSFFLSEGELQNGLEGIRTEYLAPTVEDRDETLVASTTTTLDIVME